MAKGNDWEEEGVEECDRIRADGQKEEKSRAAIGSLPQFALLTPQSVSGSAPTQAACLLVLTSRPCVALEVRSQALLRPKELLFSSRIIKFWTFVVVVVFRPNKCLRARSSV